MTTYNEYREYIQNKARKSEDEYRTHLVTFVAVNLGIFLLNMLTSRGFPWFLFVLGGWSIGMVSHWADAFIYRKNLGDLDGKGDEDIPEMKYFHKLRKNFYMHLITNIATSLFLFMINIITSPGFLWALIPAAAMGIGVASHWASYTNKLRRMDIEIDDNEEEIGVRSSNEHLDKAFRLRESTTKVINEVKGKFRGFADESLPMIDSYVETIRLLTEKEEDLERALRDINREEILEEKNSLILKKESAASQALSQEYEKSIYDIDEQLKTLDKIIEERELLGLKVVAAINSLKQLNLELISIKSKTTLEDRSIIDNFEKKSKELSTYYKDLMESYDEVYKS